MTLLVLPQLRVYAAGDGSITLTQKFVSGMMEYVKLWPGRVTVLAEPADAASSNLDNVTFKPGELPFDIKISQFDNDAELRRHFSQAEIILAGLDYRQVNLWRHARALSVPLVYISEYSLQTRKQIIRACVASRLRRLRKYLWESNLERQFKVAVHNSAGIQCNGSPTYEAYQNLSPNALLYFDTRVTADMLPSETIVNDRLTSLQAGHPLRLVFSGRLIAMKGADHLPLLADELNKRGVRFTLDIFGGGDQETLIRQIVTQRNLSDVVRVHGTVDFERELVPFVRTQTDLFVCCHRQGDPSCTYLETMSCGVPIVGYDNEAFAGIVKHSGIGWHVPMDNIRALADRIAELDRNREMIARASHGARAFAAKHTFEATMRARVEHLLTCAGKSPAYKKEPALSAADKE